MSFDLRRFMIRRKILTVLGASFHVYDEDMRVVAFCRQRPVRFMKRVCVFRS